MFTWVRNSVSRQKAGRESKRNSRRINRRIARANALKKGKWYKFLGQSLGPSPQTRLYAYPSRNSAVLTMVPNEAMVFFIEFVDNPEIGRAHEYGEMGTWKFIKVGYQDLFGYMAIFYEGEEFPAYRHFQLLY